MVHLSTISRALHSTGLYGRVATGKKKAATQCTMWKHVWSLPESMWVTQRCGRRLCGEMRQRYWKAFWPKLKAITNLTLPMSQDTWSVAVAASPCRDASHQQGLRIMLELKKEWKEQYIEKYCLRTCFSPLKNWSLGRNSPFCRTMIPSTRPKPHWRDSRTKR